MAPSRHAPWYLRASFAIAALVSSQPGLAQHSPATSPADAALRAGQFDRAATLLEQAAKAGDAEAQYKLASLYRMGRGVEQDEAAAFRWMKSAALQGHADAQRRSGSGRRVPGWRRRPPTAAAKQRSS